MISPFSLLLHCFPNVGRGHVHFHFLVTVFGLGACPVSLSILTLYPLSSLGLCEAVIITPAAAPSFFTANGWKQTASFKTTPNILYSRK